MKYGLLINEVNQNIGDDIQAYAEAQFLPRVDIMVDREHLDTFEYGDGQEPVALIMGAWFMWRKWNWPPARQIVPLNVGYHHFNRKANLAKSSTSAVAITSQHYSGVGGQWFRDHGPVGCRDLYTCGIFDKAGIPNYFSGCVTLTLPEQPETPDKGTYIVCVDLNKDVERKVVKLTGGQVEVRNTTHSTPNIKGATWEERKARVEDLLTLYQNARYVVTRRLHVALPCLAMGVPVMVIQAKEMNDPHRFDPYRSWLHYCNNEDFLRDGYSDFDFVNGTPNSTEHLPYREKLIASMSEFARHCEENADESIEFFHQLSYTDEEEALWKIDFLRAALSRTHKEQKNLHKRFHEIEALLKHERAERKVSLASVEELSAKNKKLEGEIKRIKNSGSYKLATKIAIPVKAVKKAVRSIRNMRS